MSVNGHFPDLQPVDTCNPYFSICFQQSDLRLWLFLQLLSVPPLGTPGICIGPFSEGRSPLGPFNPFSQHYAEKENPTPG
ncbi:hypothetical protein KL86DPRO_10683 [uncultured delta proteobacterium]|uniref:Uncharacterized protein n=1 Tax=uncultured delta proteobacterium TaxID=34034 RepID=A0A212J594_9DELT|nr:hypothetical protein KL86DPRO_10683 [uncultured delta proteobacterium]